LGGWGGVWGAGRPALVSSLFGAARSRVSGTLALSGGPPRPPFDTPLQAIAAGLALVSEDRKRYGLVLDASVSENLTLASLRRFVRRLLVDDKTRESQASQEASALRIRAPGLGAPVRQLSGGNQQKVVLGKWLMTKPRVLFLDEPTRGVDVGAKAEIHRLIAELAETGLGVVLVSSDLPELLGMSHRVLVLSLGAATAELSASEATPEAVMTAATVRV
jgi:D-xylose transport system ATP-binding protein